jgi:predicted secreted protein
MLTRTLATGLAVLVQAGMAQAQFASNLPTPQPIVTVSASATSSVANDRMHAWLRAEADGADATQAGNEVNARMARALARAKNARGVEAATSGYSTYPVESKDKAPRWRVSQTLTLESSDFLALAGLVTRLQADDGLLVSGMTFSVSPAAQRAADDALTEEAIRNWQQRAQLAAKAFGGAAWRPGHVTVQTSEPGRPVPMMRVQALGAQAAAAPVSVEGGRTDVNVTVSGEVILEPAPAPMR